MSIPLEALLNVRTIVAHRYPTLPCADGTASALILRDVLLYARVVFVTHGPELDGLEPEPGMLFCDIAPAPATAQRFVDAGAIVLDHHRTARSVVDMFGDRGVFADEANEPGVSGAVFAFREAWVPLASRQGGCPLSVRLQAERFAQLAGVRDTWQRLSDDWERACEQAEALVFWPWESLPKHPFSRDYNAMIDRLAIGPVLMQRRAATTARLRGQSYGRRTNHGTRVVVVPSKETSDVADAVGDEADLVVGFAYEDCGATLGLSLRSRGTFDCAAFCRAHGGGGHTRAAGCRLAVEWVSPQPYAAIFNALNVWGRAAPYAP